MAKFVRERGKKVLQVVRALLNGVTEGELRAWGSPAFPDAWWHFLDEEPLRTHGCTDRLHGDVMLCPACRSAAAQAAPKEGDFLVSTISSAGKLLKGLWFCFKMLNIQSSVGGSVLMGAGPVHLKMQYAGTSLFSFLLTAGS